MSIDAKISSVVLGADGSGYLVLVDRPAAASGGTQGIAGQRRLTFNKSPDEVFGLNNLSIWGSADNIMLGDMEIAKRKGYTEIIFCNDDSFKMALSRYHARYHPKAAPARRP